MHVLVVEDDEAIAAPLCRGLERERYTVTHVTTGTAALEVEAPDLVLLDIGLPDMDGFEVCRRLRLRSDVPVIVVSARGEEIDRVVGLELGADDYVVKPFGLRELVARIRAVTRRTEAAGRGDDPEEVLRHGPLTVDAKARRVWVDDVEVVLTRKEFDLLALLASDPGTTQTRDGILTQVWDAHWYGPTKTLDVHVATLRRKLGQPHLIETVRGVGFRLADPA